MFEHRLTPLLPWPAFRARLLLFLSKLRVTDHVQRLLERRRVVAAVVAEPRCGRVWKFIFADEILEPNLGWIHFQFRRKDVYHPLDSMSGFRTSCAAISIRCHAIGKHTDNVGANILALVKAGQHQDG